MINRCFNIGSYIMTIHDANMNPSAPQCKNCWKWDYTTFACQIQELNTMVHTRVNITNILHGITK